MLKISSAANTLAPAWLAIRQRGYDVQMLSGNETDLCIARKDGLQFVAEDTVLLLGLIAMYETRGENWKATDAEIDEFMRWDGSQ